MDFYKAPALQSTKPNIYYGFVYLLAVLFSYHTLLIAYNTSSFLGQFLPTSVVGIVHAASALGAVGLFLLFPKLLRRFGNVPVGLGVMGLCCALLVLAGLGGSPGFLIAAMAILLMVNPLLYLVIDVFSETLIGNNEGDTGERRGLTLTLMSAAAVLAPLSMGYLMQDGNYTQLFFAAAGVGLLFCALVIGAFRRFNDPVYETPHLTPLLRHIKNDVRLRTVCITHFLLQLFFAWVVIYVPLYLFNVVGFSWLEIGVIIASGLLAYVIFEFPIGILADRVWGEKEMMAVGFVILAITTASFGLLGSVGIIGWMLVMFINRFGASLVEVTTESYFFKQTGGGAAGLMSVFRLLRPAANVLGAFLGAVSLAVLPWNLFFIFGAGILIVGLYVSRYIVDTR